jgi:Tfp pilus assembly protein PilO
MAMTSKERQQFLILAIFLGVAGAAGFWMYWRGPKIEQERQLQNQIDTLQARVDAARRDLASGTVESIRQRNRDYEATLEQMKELVPTRTEVTTLIDEISARAKRNAVEIGTFNPMGLEAGPNFDIDRYRWVVLGHYNQIGVLMSDIAQLSRIMVPYDLTLTLASENEQQAFADTTGALIRAQFMLRTFVKPQAGEGQGGDGGDVWPDRYRSSCCSSDVVVANRSVPRLPCRRLRLRPPYSKARIRFRRPVRWSCCARCSRTGVRDAIRSSHCWSPVKFARWFRTFESLR